MNANRYRPTPAAALIVSPDALGAALVGAAVEVSGLTAGFPAQGESPRDAVRRMRPSHLLIDCDSEHLSDESLIGPALMVGARIFLFGAERRMRMKKHLAIRFHIGAIELPNDVNRLPSILRLPAAEAPASEPA